MSNYYLDNPNSVITSKSWIEIYFDAEDIPAGIKFGGDKKNLWKLVMWKLDESNEPIVDGDDTGIVLANKLNITQAMVCAKQLKRDLKKYFDKVYVSALPKQSRFPIKTIEYELLAYEL